MAGLLRLPWFKQTEFDSLHAQVCDLALISLHSISACLLPASDFRRTTTQVTFIEEDISFSLIQAQGRKLRKEILQEKRASRVKVNTR